MFQRPPYITQLSLYMHRVLTEDVSTFSCARWSCIWATGNHLQHPTAGDIILGVVRYVPVWTIKPCLVGCELRRSQRCLVKICARERVSLEIMRHILLSRESPPGGESWSKTLLPFPALLPLYPPPSTTFTQLPWQAWAAQIRLYN